MKRYIACVLAAVMLFANMPVLAAQPETLQTASQTVYLEQTEIALPAYEAADEWYVPIKLIAGVLGGDVYFDAERNAVEIINEAMQDYDAQAARFAEFVQNTARNVRASYHELQFYGENLGVDMLLIDGHNFVSLEEAANLFEYELVVTEQGLFITNDPLITLDSETKAALGQYLADEARLYDALDDALFDSIDFAPYQVIFIGENHAIAANFDIMFEAIRYLSQNYGLRYLLEEGGYCEAMLLNNYLASGDERIIDEIVSGAQGSFAYNQNIYDFYVKLYEYNQTLPEDKKFVYLGLDVQHNTDKGQTFLLGLYGAPEEMPEVIASGKALLEEKSWKQFDAHARENEDAYQRYFGEQYRQFYYGLRNVMQSIAFYDARDFGLRETYIHENFRDLYADYEIDKCFGMFGSAHVFKENYISDDMPNLASYIDWEMPDVNVLSIINYYQDSYNMTQNAQGTQLVSPAMGQIIGSMLREASEGSAWALFPVFEENTPLHDTMFGGMLDYILLVKDSPAAMPYGVES